VTGSDVTAIVVSWNSSADLPRALASVRGRVAETIVVDNASNDGTPGVAQAHGARLMGNGANLGFAAAANQGLRGAATPLALLLNPDAELRPGALDALLAVLDARPQVAVVGPRTRNEDGSIQLSFGPDLGLVAERRQRRLVRGIRRRDPAILGEVEAQAAAPHDPDWVSGSCWLARRSAVESVGGFDEAFFLYEEDADLCRRLRAAGWEIAFTPQAEVVHRLGGSANQAGDLARRAYDASHLRYYAKHNGPLATLLLRLWRRTQR
jgi:GT2 family glycosyltransferase